MVFKIISDLLMSVDKSVEFANAAAKAYHIGTGGDPADYMSFAVDDQQQVAMNLAGVYAVQTAAGVIAEIRSAAVSEDEFWRALGDIATGNLSDLERSVARRCANLAWKAGQPFRSLERVTRSAMVDFNLLPLNEISKDDDQLQTAARELIKCVGRLVAADN